MMEYNDNKLDNSTNAFSDELYHYFVNDRINLANFLSDHCDLLEYDTIRAVLARICKEKNVSFTDLMNGNIGGQHNSRMSISIFPTLNLFRILTTVMNKLELQKLEDIGSGVGLVPHIFKSFNTEANRIITNSHQKNKPTGRSLMSNLMSMIGNRSSSSSASNVQISVSLYKNIIPLESIIGSDPKYFLSTAITMNNVTLLNRDLTDYIINEKNIFDPDAAYLIMDPYVSQDIQSMAETIVNFVETRRPKLFIVMGDYTTNFENAFTSYRCFKLIPKTFCCVDSAIHNLMGGTTHYKMYIFIRSDVDVNLDQFMFEIDDDVLEEIKDISFDAVALMTEHKKIPQAIYLSDDRYNKAANILRDMYTLQINTLPLHLENITEIESYLNLYKTAYSDMQRHPNILQIRENFLRVNEYLDLVYKDLNKLKLQGIVPCNLTIDNAASFILRDYSFSDKKITNVHNRYITMSRR